MWLPTATSTLHLIYPPPKDQTTVNTVSGQSLVSKAANIKVELMILSVSSTGHDIYQR